MALSGCKTVRSAASMRASVAVRAEVPVVFVAFDLLAHGTSGVRAMPLLEEPLSVRRRRLEALGGYDAAEAGRVLAEVP